MHAGECRARQRGYGNAIAATHGLLLRRIVLRDATPAACARHVACCPTAGGVHETGGPGGVRAAAARRAPGLYHVRAYAGSTPARWLPQLRAARLSDGLVSTVPGAHPEQRRDGL